MAEKSDAEKTEEPTPKKIEDARKEGQVAQSRELPNALVLATALLVFLFFGEWIWETGLEAFRTPLRQIGVFDLNQVSLKWLAGRIGVQCVMLLSPLLLGIMLAGIVANVVQVGLMVTGKSLVPNLSKINPLEGFKRTFFSARSLVELIKSIAKIALISYVVYRTILASVGALISLTNQDTKVILVFVMLLLLKIFWRVTIVMLILGVLDYSFQRFDWKRQLKMTKQEVKDEYKQIEGDPHVKGRIRQLQREAAMRRMMKEVPKADVVITNPTQYAVALKYDRVRDAAPRVVAKGRGKIAERIRELARLHGVPILERPVLARELYKSVKVDHLIPAGLYQAVAEILAYVYRMKEKRSG